VPFPGCGGSVLPADMVGLFPVALSPPIFILPAHGGKLHFAASRLVLLSLMVLVNHPEAKGVSWHKNEIFPERNSGSCNKTLYEKFSHNPESFNLLHHTIE